MLKYLAAFAIAFAIRFLSGLLLEGGWLREPELTPLARIPLTVIVPVIIAGMTLAIINRVSPRRLFDMRVKRSVSQSFVGLGAGLLAAALSAGAVVFIESLVMKAVLTGAIAALATIVLTLRLPKARVDECVHCGSPFGANESRCPGCGAMDSRGLSEGSAAAA